MTLQERLQFRDRLTDGQAEALTAWAEARNQPVLGIVAVINTIRNRARLKRQRSSYMALATAAYSCWLTDEHSRNDDALVTAAHFVVAGEPLPEPDVVLETCMWLASRADLPDVTGGATHYYAPRYIAAPPWTVTDATHHPRKTVTIGDHEFWTNVLF